MIYLLVGENVFARDENLARIVGDGDVERYGGDEVDESRMVDIFAGATLFASQRTVVIDELSQNKSMWALLPDRIGQLDDATTLVLCETRLDKRTKAYKTLQKRAKVIDCTPWSLRQSRQAEQWLTQYARTHDVKLSPAQVDELVARAVRPGLDDQPMIDQAQLATVVGQLRNVPEVTSDVIDTVMAGESHDNVFGLLDAALAGDQRRLDTMITRLQPHQDGHRVMALLSSQAVQLAGLVLARESGITDTNQIASDIGAHPYALRQLERRASNMSRSDAARLIERLAWADERLKRGAKPWQLIAIALRTIQSP